MTMMREDAPTSRLSPEWARSDAARISSEIASQGLGTDPFVAAVRATRMPMIITNPRLPDNPVVFANDAFCRLTGYARPEIVGRNCRFLQGPLTDPASVAKIRAAVAAHQPLEIDIRNHRKNGEPFWNRLLMAPVADETGALAYYFASQVDVTIERERLAGLESHNAALMAEVAGRLRAQQDSEDRLRFATVAGRLGIWELDLRGGEFTASATCKLHFGHHPQTPFTESEFRAAIHPEDRALVADAIGHAVANSAEFDIECRVRQGGWVQMRAQVMHAADGAPLRMAGISQDITERRQANDILQQRVAAALAERETVEEALRQSQKMEAVGQLTGGIAHDFNNLLAGIIGSLELMQRRVAAGRTEGLERYTTTAITSAQRAAALTQRLLAFARRQPLDPRRVDANRLVAGMDDLLRRTLGPAVQLEMVLAGGLWPTLCDPNQLESAILNVAINARDAMPGGGRLTIETANTHLDEAYARAFGGEVRPGQYVGVSVTDTGVGMSPEVAARAFDPFFTTKPTGQGTGLGLSMLYGFIKQSDGHVRIYSEPGQGTTFRLYLPRYRGPSDEEEARDTADDTSTVSKAEAGETVLVVDDDPIVRMLVVETLGELGYAALEAIDGPSGLRILDSSARVDLLVTDVGLPGLNGRQIADAARIARPGLRVLFITGFAHNAAIGQGTELDAGMEIMSKPFTLDALAKKIQAMIEAA
jgi:PAS domain S-box-containing protein